MNIIKYLCADTQFRSNTYCSIAGYHSHLLSFRERRRLCCYSYSSFTSQYKDLSSSSTSINFRLCKSNSIEQKLNLFLNSTGRSLLHSNSNLFGALKAPLIFELTKDSYSNTNYTLRTLSKAKRVRLLLISESFDFDILLISYSKSSNRHS